MYPQHGQTETQNEILNRMIWYHVPKHVYVRLFERHAFETGVYHGVVYFNIRNLATLRIFKSLLIEPGTYTRLCYSALNKNRIKNAKCHNKPIFKSRQRVLFVTEHKKQMRLKG